VPPPPVLDRIPPFAVELMLGQQLGVRGQFAVYSDSREAVVVEGYYGWLYTDIGSSQAVGAGARWLLRGDALWVADSIIFGPGVDVFYGLNHNSLILLTPSLDLAWVFKLGPSLEAEIGLEAGLGVGLSGHTDHGHSAVGEFTPVISLYTGLRF
jgi:hypothetical protein